MVGLEDPVADGVDAGVLDDAVPAADPLDDPVFVAVAVVDFPPEEDDPVDAPGLDDDVPDDRLEAVVALVGVGVGATVTR